MSVRRGAAIGLSLGAAAVVAALAAWAAGVGPFGGDERTTLKVMTFNVFYGGDEYDLAKDDWCATTNGCDATLDKVVEAIAASGADATQVPALSERIRLLEGVVATGMPVFLVGDFNSPSQLDWTEAVAEDRDEVRYSVAWPVGALAERSGFRDSYREAHPDPIAKPGFTWTPGGPESVKNEVHDRIDWVLAAGPAETVASEVVGESDYADTDIAADPFPSDHRGVVSTFSVEPADTPTLVSLEQRGLHVGDEISASVHAADDSADHIAIVPRGAGPEDAVGDPGDVGDEDVTLPTAGLAPGAYDMVLVTSAGEVLSRAPFWLYPPGARPKWGSSRAHRGPATRSS